MLNQLDLGLDVPLCRPRVRADVLCLLDNLLHLLAADAVGLVHLHVDAQAHVERLHVADEVHRRLDDAVGGQMHLHAHGASVHGGLEAGAVAGGEELL